MEFFLLFQIDRSDDDHPYLWDDFKMVADDMDPFFVSSKAVFKRFLNALGEDSKPTCGTGDWAKTYSPSIRPLW